MATHTELNEAISSLIQLHVGEDHLRQLLHDSNTKQALARRRIYDMMIELGNSQPETQLFDRSIVVHLDGTIYIVSVEANGDEWTHAYDPDTDQSMEVPRERLFSIKEAVMLSPEMSAPLTPDMEESISNP